ncbi:hypothetical protein [Cryobacterium arcticum]|uniref:DUF7800 domain-containing protein n=1 Tax=Cryobacterium arcticum TaxID=670052 RepID=A0A317ZKN7_9MICO|nr:hypothetical protein [Cryobacterium arcticum]PXA67081.1 hypothetical protein CTB96_09915 [Cryobacterium arcticum]
MAGLPLLLAGPVVRRVDSTSASVWVALSEPAAVELRIFDGRQKSSGAGTVTAGTHIAVGIVASARMGPHLHIALSRADGVFTPGAIFSYDVVITTANGGPIGLKGLHLLEDDPAGDTTVRKVSGVWDGAPKSYALGYETDYLPSFVVPAAILGDIRIAHTSCRKSHAPGSDALAWLDDLVGDEIDRSGERIQQLYLTGDQIYGDDVPTCILPMYHGLATDLMGDTGGASGEEELPAPGNPGPGMANINMQTAPPMRRTVMVRTDGGLTSVESQNHLLTVGEYAAAYLTAWSPFVWRPLGTEDAVYSTALSPSPFTLTNLHALYGEKSDQPSDLATLTSRLKKKAGAEFAQHRQRVLVFAATVGKVARVLANTPTYMIFDDHDVTDDWNLNENWHRRVYSRPLGRSIVRNALVVYTFFQAWGSDWPTFNDPAHPNSWLLQAAGRYLATTRGRDFAARDELDELLDFSGTVSDDKRATFHYEAPGSLYRVKVLDSRTRRSFPVGSTAPAFLLGDSLDLQIPKGPGQAGDQFLLVIASTPALGPDLFERMVVPLAMVAFDAYRFSHAEEDNDPQNPRPGENDSALKLALKRTNGAAFVDTETWPSNPAGQHQLLSRLASYGRSVVLGGDVHYGTSMFVDWWEWDSTIGEASRKTGRIVQLTASAAHNVFEPTIEAIYRGYHWMNQWAAGPVTEGFGFTRDAFSHIKIPDGKRPTVARLHRMHDAPAILLADGWPEGTTLNAEPDWWFRQQQAHDGRSDRDRGLAFSTALDGLQPFFVEAMAAGAGLERATRAADAYSQALRSQFAPLRDIVMTNNVGLVSFAGGGNGKVSAVHKLISTTKQNYPEDKIDSLLESKKPMGKTAAISPGANNTEVTVALDPSPTKPLFNARPSHG